MEEWGFGFFRYSLTKLDAENIKGVRNRHEVDRKESFTLQRDVLFATINLGFRCVPLE